MYIIMRILVIGISGYIGKLLVEYLNKYNICWRGISYKNCNMDNLIYLHSEFKFTHIINCAAYTGNPNMDSCESNKHDCIVGNVTLPIILKSVANTLEVILIHLSTGCVYSDENRVFSELDKPTQTFESKNCGVYIASKELGDRYAIECDKFYLFRLKWIFDNKKHYKNIITKLMEYDRVIDNFPNSLTNRHECCEAIIQCIIQKVPFGIYNVVNSGFISNQEIVSIICKHIPIKISMVNEIGFLTNRSTSKLSNEKLLNVGIKMSNVKESIENCIKDYHNIE
jgi:dTDP-4-dehydrorhamnose reductase